MDNGPTSGELLPAVGHRFLPRRGRRCPRRPIRARMPSSTGLESQDMPPHRPAMMAGLLLALLAPGTDAHTIGPVADLGVSLVDVPDPVLHGAALAWVAIMTNAGPSNATGLTLTDVLPADVAFVSSVPGPPTCTLAGPTFTCDLGTLAAGATTTVTIHVTATAPAGST